MNYNGYTVCNLVFILCLVQAAFYLEFGKVMFVEALPYTVLLVT